MQNPVNSLFKFLPVIVLFTALQFITVNSELYSQQTGYRLYTVRDGLVQSEVVKLYQDKKGFLWVGTKSGVCRFDGTHFETIADSGLVSRSEVDFIGEIDDTTVGVMTRKGYLLCCRGRNHHEIISGAKMPGECGGVWVRNGKLYYASFSEDNVCIYSVDRNGVKAVEPRLAMLIRQNIFPQWKLLYYSPASDMYYFRDRNKRLCAIRNGHTVTISLVPSPIMMIGKDGFLYCQTPDITAPDHLFKSESIIPGSSRKHDETVRIYQIKDTSIYMIMDFGREFSLFTGPCFFNDETDFTLSHPGLCELWRSRNGSFSTARIDMKLWNTLFIDREGNIWAGTAQGLLKTFPWCFEHFTDKDGLYSNLQFIAEDRQRNIITGGFDQGLQLLKNGKFVALPYPKYISGINEKMIYPGANLDKKGIVHICGNPFMELQWDGAHFIRTPQYPDCSGIAFFESPSTSYQYFGTNLGLVVIPPGKPAHLENISPGNKPNKVVAMAEGPDGMLILGGFDGVTIMKGNKYFALPNQEFSYTGGANTLAKDHRGNIWAGNNKGLALFDGKKFREIRNPWFNDLVVSLQVIDSSLLFIGGLRGMGFLDLQRFYREDTAVIRYFNETNGFQGLECQQNAVTLDHTGKLWVATTNSLIRIDPKKLTAKDVEMSVYITSVGVVDAMMKNHPLMTTDVTKADMILAHDQKNLRFDFAAVYFRAPEFIKYRYKLEGYDKDWSPEVKDRYAVYTNLSPGTYSFKVKACNETLEWTNQVAVVNITITPAYWQITWFWILVGMATVGFFFFSGFRFRQAKRKKIQEKLENEKKIAEWQLISLRNQIDPHFTFNAINSIASVVLKEDKETAYRFFVKLSALIRQILNSGDRMTRPLSEELEFVKNYLAIEKLRFGDVFEYSIEIDPKVNMGQEVPITMIQTYAENAIKHGLIHKKNGSGNLSVIISQENEKLIVVIEDNGIGRKKAREIGTSSTGKGMKIMNFYFDFFNRYSDRKLTLHVEDLFDGGDQDAGTRVTIVILSGFSYKNE